MKLRAIGIGLIIGVTVRVVFFQAHSIADSPILTFALGLILGDIARGSKE